MIAFEKCRDEMKMMVDDEKRMTRCYNWLMKDGKNGMDEDAGGCCCGKMVWNCVEWKWAKLQLLKFDDAFWTRVCGLTRMRMQM